MNSEKAQFLIHRRAWLKKFEGKGGWTYIEIPEIPQDTSAPFGWVRISGFIDEIKIKSCLLMPMGDKKLFLPVKASIRKALGKEAGNEVMLRLKKEDSEVEIPVDLAKCFENEPQSVYKKFRALPKTRQQALLNQIVDTKTADTRVKRIVDMMAHLDRK